MASNIAAINGGNIFGIKRSEIARLVPVIEMTSESFHLDYSLKRRFQPPRCVPKAQPTEIVRRKRRKQIEPDICRRSAMRYNGLWIFLEIVWWKRIVSGRHKSLKKAPST